MGGMIRDLDKRIPCRNRVRVRGDDRIVGSRVHDGKKIKRPRCCVKVFFQIQSEANRNSCARPSIHVLSAVSPRRTFGKYIWL